MMSYQRGPVLTQTLMMMLNVKRRRAEATPEDNSKSLDGQLLHRKQRKQPDKDSSSAAILQSPLSQDIRE